MSNRGAEKLDSLVRGALPTRCVLCAEVCDERLLCAPCLATLPALASACPVCALPSPGAAVCGACLAHPPKVARTLAACVYAFPVDRLVHELKYARRLALAVPLGVALAAVAAHAVDATPDLVVPMPLAAARQRQRGFNQAAEIARVVVRRRGGTLRYALARVHDRPPQAGLPWRERRRNVRGAFRADAAVAGRHVALVDDVMTTGATLEAAASALLRAGARRVDAWVVARALPPGGA